jgi:hypothetical protein
MESVVEITVAKTGSSPVQVKLPLNTTVAQAISLIDSHPSFTGQTFQKFITTANRQYVDSLIGASGVDTTRVMVNGDSLSYVSKVDSGL